MARYTNSDYEKLKKMTANRRLPLAFVDLPSFDRNVAYVADLVRPSGKTVRVATKSIRSVDLIGRVLEKGGEVFQGLMAFTVEEAAFLVECGFDDILVAYPTVQTSDLGLAAEMVWAGTRLVLMVDSVEHLKLIGDAGSTAGVIMPVCLDLDMGYRALGGYYIGARRSPVRTVEQVLEMAEASLEIDGVSIDSVMGYEAQIASVGDNVPGRNLKNKMVRRIKKRSISELTGRRSRLVKALRDKGCPILTVNGGGSGSLASTIKDPVVTEVTAGSAFFAPALFHDFSDVIFEPAAFFALQAVRTPAEGMVTCLGGGYVASGAAGPEKLPRPILPEGIRYLPLEGAGEVQTPLVLPAGLPDIQPGDPVFFQHAKAGELCERFDRLLLVENDDIVGEAATYRGQGRTFL